ncbi:protein MRG1-like isoform X2 [Silene latifolia]|uniref:protein MRG1-like isoform X2 n=1 Tax=Silene latifolia TaxID=37657 RepID=UPI003D7859C0
MRNSKDDSGGAAATAIDISPPPPPPSVYEEGEAVIANHKGYFYLAKVEKIKFNKDWKYLIHYIGWNKRCSSNLESPIDQQFNNWDEWLGIDHLLKQTTENLKKVSDDTKKTTDKYAKTGHISQNKLDASSGPSGKKLKTSSTVTGRKRKREHNGKKGKDSDLAEKLVSIYIPLTLKKQLIDDFESINQMDKLVRLPRTPNVDAVIEKYLDYRGKKEGVISNSVEEVLSGLCVYFNKALPVLLLYNKERQQYQEVIMEDSSCLLPSAVYGAEHLLRLFVKLPALLYELDMEEKTRRELQTILQDFLKFLQRNQSVFFLSSYHLQED